MSATVDRRWVLGAAAAVLAGLYLSVSEPALSVVAGLVAFCCSFVVMAVLWLAYSRRAKRATRHGHEPGIAMILAIAVVAVTPLLRGPAGWAAAVSYGVCAGLLATAMLQRARRERN